MLLFYIVLSNVYYKLPLDTLAREMVYKWH